MDDPHVILLVEDLEDDILLVKQSFERVGLRCPVHSVRSGEEAISYMQGQGKYALRGRFPLPNLILLDLKMPGIDGFEFLEWLRAQPRFQAIPVVALTASDHIKDVNRAYQLGANSFLVKPHDFQNFVETSRQLQRYWLKLSLLPPVTPEAGAPFESAGPAETIANIPPADVAGSETT